MKTAFDIAIVGAGPAGGNAALAAARAGLDVVLLDEQPAPGGQVWRGKSAAIQSAPATPESKLGDTMRADLAASDAKVITAARVWDIARGGNGWTLHALVDGASRNFTARALILSTGAREYVQPVPGWTLPGVIGLAGATALFKQTLTVPGQNTVVSGTGPLVFYVASEIRRLGGSVAAIVTPNSRADWARSLPAMAHQPKLLARGAVWMADLMLARVPILWAHGVRHVGGENTVQTVQTCDLKTGAAGPEYAADSLCMGHGLVPNIEAAQMLGVPIRHDPELGGWVPEATPEGVTSVPGLYLCGDGCGIRGALAAAIQGTMTGKRAARDLGRAAAPPPIGPWLRAARFGQAMTKLSMPLSAMQALTTEDSILCRCENLSCAEIRAEISAGAHSTNAVKSGMRAGMGPCGGKYCQTAIAALIAQQTGKPLSEIPPSTPRPPLRPIPLGQAAGAFAYEDLPIPKPAPL